MKRTNYINLCTIVLALSAVLTSSCISSQSFLPVKGSGMAIDKNFRVSDFHGIDVSGGFDVVLVQGNSEDLTLTAQENLFDYIIVEVEQGILKIYTENNIMPTRPLKARISFKSIDNLEVSGGGDIICETSVNVPNLGVNISGGGDISSEINTDELTCKISGGGDAKINGSIKIYKLDLSGGGDITSDINATSVFCTVSGGGDVLLKSREKAADANIIISGGGDLAMEMNIEKLRCSISGGGDATLSGQASEFEVTVNGGGDVSASNLSTNITSFHANGGSDIHVNASQELTGYISGGGNVYYSGNPEKFSVDAKGGSEVRKE
jgi:hypothetical protein